MIIGLPQYNVRKSAVEELVEKYASIFEPGIGTVQGAKAICT